jgi:hypothetical protein
LLESSGKVELNYSDKSFESTDLLDEFIIIKPENFDTQEAISITIKIEEIENNVVKESRGFTTLIVTQ